MFCAPLSMVYFPVRWRFSLGSIPGGTVSQAFICRFKALRPSSGQEYGANYKNAIQGKITGVSGQKIICTLTI